jgi:hypothetical protein
MGEGNFNGLWVHFNIKLNLKACRLVLFFSSSSPSLRHKENYVLCFAIKTF